MTPETEIAKGFYTPSANLRHSVATRNAPESGQSPTRVTIRLGA